MQTYRQLIAVAVVGCFGAISGSGVAHAQTTAEKFKLCELAGAVAEAAAEARESGVPIEEFKARSGMATEAPIALIVALITLSYWDLYT